MLNSGTSCDCKETYASQLCLLEERARIEKQELERNYEALHRQEQAKFQSEKLSLLVEYENKYMEVPRMRFVLFTDMTATNQLPVLSSVTPRRREVNRGRDGRDREGIYCALGWRRSEAGL